MFIASRPFLKNTEIRTEEDGIFVQEDSKSISERTTNIAVK